MAKIKLKVSISGTRDGAEWPPVGFPIDLPDGEAAQMIAAGLAVECAAPDGEAAQMIAAGLAVECAAPVETATADTSKLETRKRARRG